LKVKTDLDFFNFLTEFNLNFRKNKQMPRPWAINLADNKARWQSLAGKLMN
jgi:hypothetical protein